MAARRAASSLSSLLCRSPAQSAASTLFSQQDFQHYRLLTRSSYHVMGTVGNNLPAVHLISQRRLASSQAAESKNRASNISTAPSRENKENQAKESGVVYEGPISSTIKKVKLLSLSTCCLSVSLGPVITFMTSTQADVILKGGVASTVIFLSASTTAALHWFVSPYIHKLKWQPGSNSFEVEMMSWLATPITKTVKFADVRPPESNRPFVTFKADDNFYFVDSDHCHNKALLARLTPQKTVHESAFKNL